MEGPRALTIEEYPELVEFLDTNLRSKIGWSITAEYPTTFTTQNLDHFRIVKDEEKILSHALVKPLIVRTRRGVFKVACIGSVITENSYRNTGLSQAVLRDSLSTATQQGCDFAILWTNLYDFYRKLNFELAGSEVSLVLDQVPPTTAKSPYKIVTSNKVDPQALFRLYSQHTVSSARTFDDLQKFLAIPQCRLTTAWDATNKLVAYAAEGKGADLQGYIHEWGGQVDALVDVIIDIRKRLPAPVTVIAPSHAQNLIRTLVSLGARRVDGFLGMIKITNFEAFAQKITRNIRQEWGFDNFVLEKRDAHYYFGFGDDLFKTDSEADIVKLIFGPIKPSQLHDGGAQVNEKLDKIFPIEMWVWGWDSV